MKKRHLAILVPLIGWSATATADQQVLDDHIVEGKSCIGVDCNNGEVFGRGPLKLKQNNTRIRFQDTSNSASFPTRDWRIVANDSTNGGRNYLAFEDTDAGRMPFMVMADAPVNALHVSSDGLGFGTDSPERSMHLSAIDSPSLRLEQNGAGGWTPQTFDVGGNESGFFLRDITNGTQPFRIAPGSDNDAIVITPGNVDINGTLNNDSSRSVKHGIEPVDPAQVLAGIEGLEISRWQYLKDVGGIEHLGPMAEDFHDAFGLGRDNKHISPTDVAGVAIASAQALSSKVKSQAAEIERLEQKSADLEARLRKLEASIDAR